MDKQEKNARVVGGVAAGTTVAGTVAAASGASAAAITGTIATIGGGSLVAGLGVVAAAPVAIGAAAYGLWKWLKD